MLENMFYQPNADIEKIKKIYTNLDKSVQETKPVKKLAKWLLTIMPPKLEKAAPEFSAPTEGKWFH